ncbi:MAG: MlaD family protein [Deltaproteobacteria bacterium]|nr:MlaD family protein [Deltaproteobacteria bacterium]
MTRYQESQRNIKIGVFTLIGICILVYSTIRVSDRNLSSKGTYTVSVVLTSATGLTRKTPVQIAGVQVGYIESLDLVDNRRARVGLRINKEVQLTEDVTAQVRTKGFLGETYIDLMPGRDENLIKPNGEITSVNPYTDLSELTSKLSAVTDDIKVVTESMKRNFVEGGNWDQIMSNFAQLSQKLNTSLSSVSNITQKIDEGKGTIGRLVNDEETIENINQAAKGLSETIGGVNRFQAEIGYHLEYLGNSQSVKNYVSLGLKPRPDKAFLLDFVVDPNPPDQRRLTTTDVTSGGVTTTVTTDQSVTIRNKFLISAQLAKTFRDVTIRGGIIESTGGVGVDYKRGPYGLSFSAFDFRSDYGERPHLKAFGQVNLTKNFYLLSGMDDFIAKNHERDWFVGAGFQVIDEDLKSLFGAARLK